MAVATIDVLANDTDIDLHPTLNNPMTEALTVVSNGFSGVANGEVSIVDNKVVFTPTANWNGTETFTYTVKDNANATATASVTVTVDPINDAPTAYDDSITIDEDTSATIDVLDNDTDIDLHETLNNPMTEVLTIVADSFSGVDNGVVSIVDNKVVFTPTTNWNGTETFTYTMKDSYNVTATASVTVTVDPINDAPVANDYNLNLNEDNSLDQQVLWTSTDYDLVPSLNNPVTDTHTITITSGPSHGTGSVVTNSIRYTPTANYNGPDSITYEIEDSFHVITTATITYTVEPVNDEPTAYDDSITIDEDGSRNY